MKQELSPAHLRDLIQAARGRRKCDLVIRGADVVNVFTGELARQDVGIFRGHIAAVSSGGGIDGEQIIDAAGLHLAPGFIDSHMHLESSLLTPAEFARFVLPLGTTAVVIDPHEIANVAGSRGVTEMMSASEDLPVTFYFVISPCVPASELDVSGGRMDVDDVCRFADSPRVLGIGEMMDFPGILAGREDLLRKMTCRKREVVDGHAPGLVGRDLQAYAAAGITSDHETTSASEGVEKLRAGMYLMIREGSAARDLDALAGLVDARTVHRCLLVTDDLLPTDLEERGHIDYLLRRIVRGGVSSVDAIRMATINPAQRFRIDRTGAIAPGYAADIVALEDLAEFRAAFVVAGGELVAERGETLVPIRPHQFGQELMHTVHLPELSVDDLAIPAGEGCARVIEAAENQVTTRHLLLKPRVERERVEPDLDNDVLKIAAVERYGRSGSIGLGLVKGFHLKAGAMAGSVAHDSHNIVAVGTNDTDILRAVERIGEMDGGLAVVRDRRVTADLALPIGGLMALGSARSVARDLRRAERAARDLGCAMEHPFATLSFMCLSVVPELKLTAAGLVDVNEFRIVPLFETRSGKTERAAAC